MAPAPRLVITGAAGFLGKRLIEALGDSWRIEAIDHIPPVQGALVGRAGVRWHPLDVADRDAMAALFDQLRRDGGAAALIHLAAHYDFTGERHPEYQRTNVGGTRVVLDTARALGLERFVFASSVAACDFPPPGRALDESSPPDGRHVYAESKRAGEQMVRAETAFPTAIVRFAALFSDWCEYAPLYKFIGTWLSGRWNARVLGGRGRSAVPYLHVRDVCLFLERVLERRRDFAHGEVLIASPNGATTHEELFRAATGYAFGRPVRPIRMPRPLAALGIRMLDAAGRAVGERPFERPWMAAMIDKRLEVDARRSQARLGWAPRARLDILRRMPFLIENLRSEPGAWAAHNEAALHAASLPPNLQVLRLLEEHEDEIFALATREILAQARRMPHYAAVPAAEHDWNHRLLLRHLAQAVRDRQRGLFRGYCHDLARRRAGQGFPLAELRSALTLFERVALEVLAADPRAVGLGATLRELVSVTVEFGIDAIEDGYEELGVAVADDVEEELAPAENR